MYNRFRDKQVNNALSFISTGSNVGNTVPISGANSRGCIDSSDCASGWACNGGICRQTDNGPDGSGSSDGCGSGSSGGGNGSGCGAGPDRYLAAYEDFAEVYTNALKDLKAGDVLLTQGLNGDTVGNGLVGISLNGKCLKTGCTGTSTRLGGNDACCGQGRCCRLGASVQCFCGKCPEPPQNCSKFCTSYLAANGELAPGCTDDNTCDECSSCVDYGNFQGTGCKKKSGGPCWCEDGGRSCSGACSKCEEDGLCRDSCENCQTCYTRLNYDCGCGTVDIECCYSACDGTKGFQTCVPDCDELCGGGGGDPCAGSCRTVTTCTPESPPPCPPKSTCRTSGTIEAGGQTCTLTEICDKSDVPDSCGECDCNCDNDCPSCQTCNQSTGKCQPDPGCEGKHYLVKGVFKETTTTGGRALGEPSCRYTTTVSYTTPVFYSGQLGAPGDLGIGHTIKELTPVGPFRIQTECPVSGCVNGMFRTRVKAFRSDGTTSAEPGGLQGTMFKETYCTDGAFASRFTYKRIPGGLTMFYGFGDTPTEAGADLQSQLSAAGF